MKAIQINNLKKSYGKHEVLKGCTLSVNQGEIFGILGVNGAGKTTMLDCIEGFRKYEGSIEIIGSLGIQLQSASLPAYIQVKEIIELISLWKHTKIDLNVLNALEVNLIKNKKYFELSTGQKRRLHLVLALIGELDVLILDEPTAGLDVEGRISLHEEIKRLKKLGKTILLTSHDMSEVEDLCDRIAILNKGKIDFLGTVDELAQKVGKQYEIKIQTEFNEEIYMTNNIGDKMFEILQKYKSENIDILDIKVSRGSLEQHFMNIARGEQQ